jgi:hypothetical protein
MVFEAFRKRQKEMLAALVLIAMFVFIAGDLPTQFIYGDRANANPRVGEMWGKPRTASDIQKLDAERSAAYAVLQRMVKAAGKQGDERRLSSVFSTDPWRMMGMQGIDWRFPYLALEGKADQLGIKVSDEDVTEFLKQITGNALGRQEFRDALAPPRKSGQTSRDRTGETVTEHELYRIVAREMKIRRVLEALTPAADRTLPLDYWRQPLEDARATFHLEMVRVPVEKFVDPKAEPTNSDLQAVYNRYKSITPDPDRGIVGFQRPSTATFEYVSIPTEKWLDQVQVTEEELKKYYDQNQKEFPEDVPVPPAPAAKGDASKGPPAAKGAPMGESATKENVPAPPKKDATKQDEKAKADEKKSAPPKPAAPKPEPKADAKGKPDAKPADKKTSATPATNLLRTIAATSLFVQAPDSKKSDDKKPAEAKPAPPKQDEAKAPPTQDVKKADAAKPDPKQPVVEKKEAPPVPTPPSAGQAKAGEGAPTPKYKPYAMVKPQIERKLKQQKARQLIRDKVQQLLQGPFAKYSEEYLLARRKYENEHNGSLEGFVPPKPPKTLEEIAKEFRGVHHKIGPATKRDVQKTADFGRLLEAPQNIFNSEKINFDAQLDSDINEDVYYVYWRTDFTPPSEAPFESVRDQVVNLWRLQEAQKPAQKAAEELSEKVKKDGFAEAVKGTDYQPFRPGGYRRSTYNPPPYNPAVRLPYIRGVPNNYLAGVPDSNEEFLDEVFRMEEGDVKVIAGDERKNFYVVKLVKREEPNFEEFAADYDLMVQALSPEQELFAQLQGRMTPKTQAQAVTALKVLEESGWTPPADRSRKGASPDDAGPEAQ